MKPPGPVAYVANRFPRWGGGWVLNEVRGLADAGLDLQIFSFRRPLPDVERQTGMDRWIRATTYVPRGSSAACIRAALVCLMRSPAGFARALWTLWKLGGRMARGAHLFEVFFLADRIRSGGATHIHAQHADYLADAALAASRYLDRPFSFTGHANDLYTNPGRLERKIAAARFVATCTGFNAGYLDDLCRRRGLDPGRIVKVYHGVDLDRFRPAVDGTAPPADRLITITRLKEKKGFPYLLDALSMLKARGRPCRLTIYGDGDQREAIQAQARRLGLETDVELMGTIDHDRIPAALTGAGMFVLPCVVLPNADRDGIPNSLIEAMASGVPVVSTRISGIPEAIEDGRSGLLVPERDAGALADAIERMMIDEDLRARCARNGREVAESMFSIEASGRALARLFKPGIDRDSPR